MSSRTATDEILRQFLGILTHLGWGLGRQSAPERFQRAREASLRGAVWTALSLPDGMTLLVVALPVSLPDFRESFRRFEDVLPLHRTVFSALRDEQLSGRYLLLLDGAAGHLVDLEEEDVLLTVESREEMGDRLLPLLDLTALSRSSLATFPRKALRQRARELESWTALWSARLGSSSELSPTAMNGFFTLLHLCRLAELHHIGPGRSHGFGDFAAAHPPAAGRFLEERFRTLHEHWNLVQEPPLRRVLEILAAMRSRDSQLDDCLRSYSLLSRSKFSSEVFAEAFADEALRLLSWRSSVTALRSYGDEDEDRPDYDALLASPAEVDLDRQGTVQMLRAFDDLTALARQSALDRQSARERGERVGLQMDLLNETPDDIPASHVHALVLRRLLRVRTENADRAALARLLLLARAVEWADRNDARDLPFPRAKADMPAAPVKVIPVEMN